jgi:hypothetical protein
MDKKHFMWVDIAKALAVVSIIISNTVEDPSDIRTLLVSFGMPLLFITSGFSMKLALDKSSFFQNLKQDFLKILLPDAIFSVACIALQCAFDGDFSQIVPYLKTWLISRDEFYFGAGSILWLMLALFTAKTLINLISSAFKTERSELFYVLLGIAGLYLGQRNILLPFYFDLALVSILFMEVGIFWRRHEDVIEKYRAPLILASLVVWFNLLNEGTVLELPIRYYPNGLISLAEAIAASFVVCQIAKIFEDCAIKSRGLIPRICLSLAAVGRSAVILYFIHCLDELLLGFIWNLRDGTIKMYALSTILRLALDILIFVVIRFILNIFKPRQKRKNIV